MCDNPCSPYINAEIINKRCPMTLRTPFIMRLISAFTSFVRNDI